MRWRVPSQSTGGASRQFFASSEKAYRVSFQNWHTAPQQAFGEAGDLGRRSEDACMPGDTGHNPGILVVDFALDDPLAKRQVAFRGRNTRSPLLRRIKARAFHPEGKKVFLFCVAFQRSPREAN